MELRKEIESLAIWFVIASGILLLVSIIFGRVASGEQMVNWLKAWSDPQAGLLALSALGKVMSLIDNIAVGAWLFIRAKGCGYNRYLWCAFGLAGSLVGGALYLLTRFSESGAFKKSQQAALDSQ